jgi:transposase
MLFDSLELSKSKWLVTSLPAGGDKMSKHTISGGNWDALLSLLTELRRKAEARLGALPKIVSIHEAGLDGFSVHRMLEAIDVESHIVDPASIAVSRRTRRAKSDLIDGEPLPRTLMAWMRGEPGVCSIVAPPSLEDEDCRRLLRERKRLFKERGEHVNRIRGLLSARGIRGFEPLRRERLDALRTPDDRFLPQHVEAEIIRELERLVLIMSQITEVEGVRHALLLADKKTIPATTVKTCFETEGTPGSASQTSAKLLMQLKSIGPEFAVVLSFEGFYRRFDDWRQLAAYTGLAPSPWQSGQVDRDQGCQMALNTETV